MKAHRYQITPLIYLLSARYAIAANGDTPMGTVLCQMSNWMTGNVGKGIAVIAIIIVGTGALFNKVSWGQALIVGIGVAIVFGASLMTSNLNAGVTASCNSTTSVAVLPVSRQRPSLPTDTLTEIGIIYPVFLSPATIVTVPATAPTGSIPPG